jgi:parallel beta-helix repeat protein
MKYQRILILAASIALVGAAIATALFSVQPIISAAATTTGGCASYDRSEESIEVICDTTFDQLEKNIGDDSVIKNLGNGEYLLRASIGVQDNSRLTIASPAVTWLKISNEGDDSSQYHILVDGGYLDIDGVNITSWDPERNVVVEQEKSGSVPRPYIFFDGAKGAVIQNSELAYLGFADGRARGISVLDGSVNIEFRNNDFHNFWYAFYSNGARNVTLDGNKYHDNQMYAIDPHTGTRDMNITNNLVYNNPGSGIIYSLDCNNILIANNTVHDNGKNGISFSRNMHDSIVRNNTIYNSDRGILMNESPDNSVYGNIISNVSDGFYLLNQSPSIDGFTTKNRIYNNTIKNADNGFVIRVADGNTLANNTLGNITSYEYYLTEGVELEIENQHFTNDKISGGSGTNTVTISDSKTIAVDENDDNVYDTDGDSHTVKLSGDELIIVNSVK